jgi:hypothetical protein
MKQYNLQNLPFDPAIKAGEAAIKLSKQNSEETEKDGVREEAIRRLQVRQLSMARQGQTRK